MHGFGRLKKSLALLLLFITLHVTVCSIVLPRQVFEPLQDYLSLTCSVSVEEDHADQQFGDFKPPKHSFIDYTSYFDSDRLLPDYRPLVSNLSLKEPPRSVSQVFLEVPVPPPNFA